MISDHHSEMPEILRKALNGLHGQPFPIEYEKPREGRAADKKTVYLRADRIIDEVYFLERRNAPFLQIVDAVAFGLRRCFSSQSDGDSYLAAIAGGAGMPDFPSDWSMASCVIDNKRIIATPAANLVFVVGRPGLEIA